MDVVSQSALATTIEKNGHTLLDLSFQLDVHGSKLLALVNKRCKILQYFGVNFRGESRHIIGTVVFADIVSHLSNISNCTSRMIWTMSAFRQSYTM